MVILGDLQPLGIKFGHFEANKPPLSMDGSTPTTVAPRSANA